ncbi:MAG: hypothetical protein FWD73_00090 [Polyangiaceae bacterium]|nr:hypothetical protein [Polyangiaceae bacterium]
MIESRSPYPIRGELRGAVLAKSETVNQLSRGLIFKPEALIDMSKSNN